MGWRKTLNNYPLAKGINQSKAGRIFQDWSYKFLPRPSELIQTPFDLISEAIFYPNTLLHKVSGPPGKIPKIIIPGMILSYLITETGKTLSNPIKNLENLILGERKH